MTPRTVRLRRSCSLAAGCTLLGALVLLGCGRQPQEPQPAERVGPPRDQHAKKASATITSPGPDAEFCSEANFDVTINTGHHGEQHTLRLRPTGPGSISLFPFTPSGATHTETITMRKVTAKAKFRLTLTIDMVDHDTVEFIYGMPKGSPNCP